MTKFLILAGAAVALGSAATAQNGQKPIPRAQYIQIVDNRFNMIDTNHDGSLSKDELAAVRVKELEQAKAQLNQKLLEAFNRLDTNKDGKLSKEEFLAQAPTIRTTEAPEQLLSRLDTNKDGKLSADEWRAPEIAKFNKVDANHDGIVTPQEIQAARK